MSQPNQNQPIDPRILDLMIKQATEGLTEQELHELQAAGDLSEELERIEYTVASCDRAIVGEPEDAMPQDLRSRLESEAHRFFEERSRAGSDAALNGKGHPAVPAIDQALETPPANGQANLALPQAESHSTTEFRKREVVWILVAAASLLLWLSGWNGAPSIGLTLAPMPVPVQVEALAPPSTATMLAQFLASEPADLVDQEWLVVADNSRSGRVVWSDQLQEGYMVLDSLPVNDPLKNQYQLWIFDTDKAQKYPVDGGVFDVTAAGKVIVPIEAKIRVDKAVQYAVTVEKPGGVVVSDRKRLPLLASW